MMAFMISSNVQHDMEMMEAEAVEAEKGWPIPVEPAEAELLPRPREGEKSEDGWSGVPTTLWSSIKPNCCW